MEKWELILDVKKKMYLKYLSFLLFGQSKQFWRKIFTIIVSHRQNILMNSRSVPRWLRCESFKAGTGELCVLFEAPKYADNGVENLKFWLSRQHICWCRKFEISAEPAAICWCQKFEILA